MLDLEWDAMTTQGIRSQNQDCVVSVSQVHTERIQHKGVLLILCDGVGGELGGQRASQIATAVALDTYYECEASDIATSLVTAVEDANAAIKAEALESEAERMATTIVMAVVQDGVVYTAHVGDSRAYLYREGHLERLTHDHSLINDMIRAQALTEEQASKSALRNIIVRSLGAAPNNTAELGKRDLQPGDRILLCSDGLHGALTDDAMSEILKAHVVPGEAAAALLQAALEANSQDNVSASILNYRVARLIPPDPAQLVTQTKRMKSRTTVAFKFSRRMMILFAAGLAVLAVLVTGIVLAMSASRNDPSNMTSTPQNNLISVVVLTPTINLSGDAAGTAVQTATATLQPPTSSPLPPEPTITRASTITPQPPTDTPSPTPVETATKAGGFDITPLVPPAVLSAEAPVNGTPAVTATPEPTATEAPPPG